MGGKGRRRREKNYRAAHGGYSGLPPPPDHSKLDALPSKLRKIISFTTSNQNQQPSQRFSENVDKRKKGENGQQGEHNIHLNDKKGAEAVDVKKGVTDEQLKAPQGMDSDDEQFMQSGANEKKNKKRKRKEVKDLRFDMELEKTKSKLKRRERKKKYLEAKKNKHKKTKSDDTRDFPGHEKIKFGDIVEAPPKLAVIPKAYKHDASQERLRLQAIDAYRNRKGWTSRPGIHLPPAVASSSP